MPDRLDDVEGSLLPTGPLGILNAVTLGIASIGFWTGPGWSWYLALMMGAIRLADPLIPLEIPFRPYSLIGLVATIAIVYCLTRPETIIHFKGRGYRPWYRRPFGGWTGRRHCMRAQLIGNRYINNEMGYYH